MLHAERIADRHGRASPRGLYLITPDEPDTARLLARVAPLLRGRRLPAIPQQDAPTPALRAAAGARAAARCAATPACR